MQAPHQCPNMFNVTEDETLQLAVSLGPAWNQPSAQHKTEDYLKIHSPASGRGASSRFRLTTEAATRLLLAIVGVAVLITTARSYPQDHGLGRAEGLGFSRCALMGSAVAIHEESSQ